MESKSNILSALSFEVNIHADSLDYEEKIKFLEEFTAFIWLLASEKQESRNYSNFRSIPPHPRYLRFIQIPYKLSYPICGCATTI